MEGYFITRGSKLYFMPTEKTRKTTALLQSFTFRLGLAVDAKRAAISACMNNPAYLKQLAYIMQHATLEKVTTDSGLEYVKIYGKNFSFSFPMDDYKKGVVMLDVENAFCKI